jgi:hypothetical protein
MRAQQVKQAREPEPLTYRNVYGVLWLIITGSGLYD